MVGLPVLRFVFSGFQYLDKYLTIKMLILISKDPYCEKMDASWMPQTGYTNLFQTSLFIFGFGWFTAAEILSKLG